MSQIQQLFKQLASSLQSGNLASAQKAYGSLEQLLQGNPSRSQASSAQPASTTSSAVQKDFAARG
jgi:outer membrane protein assembly factor BamD (BamD/ComL family)